jgi:hypothetical protein
MACSMPKPNSYFLSMFKLQFLSLDSTMVLDLHFSQGCSSYTESFISNFDGNKMLVIAKQNQVPTLLNTKENGNIP